MAFAPQTLINFLKRELAQISEDGPIVLVRLFHVADVDTRAPLFEKQITSEIVADELAQEIIDISQQNVDTFLSSNQEKYGVETLLASGTVRGHITWLQTCNNPSKLNLEASDPPTEKGYVAMLQRQNTTLFQMIQNFVQPMLNGHIQTVELQNRSIELQTGLLQAREHLISEGFERDLKRLRLQREFEKEDAPKPRNVLGEKLLEMGIPMLMGQIGKSFPGFKETMVDGRGSRVDEKSDSGSQPVANSQKPDASSDLLELLDVVGEDGAINMAKASGDPMVEAFLLNAIHNHFHKPASSSQPSAVSSEESTSRSSVIGSQSESPTENRKPKTENQGANNGSEESTQEDNEAKVKGTKKAKRSPSQKDASGPGKVSARTSASEKVSRVVRKPNRNSKAKAPSKEDRKETFYKEDRKANGKTNGKTSPTRSRTKASSRSKTSYV